jgi:glucosamine kinase
VTVYNYPLFITFTTMLLIADSGSTKTAWRLVDESGKIFQLQTQGFNPYLQTSEDISKIIDAELLSQFPEELNFSEIIIHFYGAGCSSEIKNEIVRKGISAVMPSATIHVQHDLLAAARAACGYKPGIAAILGTGSNSCWYNGTEIVENVDSLGFILGDEGSGAHIGKTFIQAFLNKELPAEVHDNFVKRFALKKEDILDAVYKEPFPNRYLAAYSKYVFQNIREPFLTLMVADCFRQFFDKHICKYSVHKELKLNVVGSVGFYFSNILRKVAEEKGVEIEKIIEAPIAALTLYHTNDDL